MSRHLFWKTIIISAFGVIGIAGPAASESVYRGLAVSTVRAKQQCFRDQLEVSGVLTPKTDIKIWPERSGLQISDVLVEPGDNIRAGQVLARMVDPMGAPTQTVPVRSPVAGIVVDAEAIIGSYVSPTSPRPLFRIVADGMLEMRGEVLASLLPRMQVGQAAALKIMGFGALDGRITAVETSIDPLTQLGAVRISFQPDQRLRPGAFARATIDAGNKCAVTIPLSAVLYGSEGNIVQVVKGDHVETHRVDLGLLQSGLVQVQSGIDVDDAVVARAGSFLREGDLVRSIPDPSGP